MLVINKANQSEVDKSRWIMNLSSKELIDDQNQVIV